MARRLLIAAVCAAALIGCGSSTRGADSPSAAVLSYLSAVAHGDGGGACAVIADSLQTRALNTAKSQGAKASSCADLFSQVRGHMTAAQRKAFLAARVAKVSKSGNTATVTVTGADAQPTLQENGGKWLITGGIGF